MLILADFERPEHMELVRGRGSTNLQDLSLRPRGGRRETGGGALVFTAASGDDGVVLSNAGASQWYLKRDWRAYDLLLLSVHVPARQLTAEVTLAGGAVANRLETQTSIPLERGWNVLRLDLAEIGEHIPLDDIASLTLSVSGQDRPIEVLVDDILLAGNRVNLLGNPDGAEGELYVQRVGKRLRIGSKRLGSQFDIAMANGQIVAWYDTASDPNRLRNLVRGTSLGPNPIRLSAGDTQGSFLHASRGGAVVVRPQILELNDLRVVVACDWRFVDDLHAMRDSDNAPFQRWVYTIYATGQMYVLVEASVPEHMAADGLGLAVSLDSASVTELEARSAARSGDVSGAPALHYGLARLSSAEARVLFVPYPSHPPGQIVVDRGGSGDRASMVLLGGRVENGVARWSCHLRIGPDPQAGQRSASEQTRAYGHPPRCHVEVGMVALGGPAFSETSGFDSSSGSYMLAPDRDQIRFELRASERPMFSPVFTVVGSADRQAWVYVNHVLMDRVAETAVGDLIFQMPGGIQKNTIVEVLFRRTGSP